MGTAVVTGAALMLHPNTSNLALPRSPGWTEGPEGKTGWGEGKENKKAPQAANLKHFHFK